VTAASWRRHDSAQITANPAAIAGICGARTASAVAATVSANSGHRRFSSIVPGRCSGSDDVVRASASRRAIGAFVSWRRPIHAPSAPATSHQPAAKNSGPSSPAFAALSTAIAPSTVADAAQTRTVVFRKSTNRT
jgi:hypothetical protein